MASSKGKITRHHFVVSYSAATPESIEVVFANGTLVIIIFPESIEVVFASGHSLSSSLSFSSSSSLQRFLIQRHFVGSYSLTSPHVY